MLKRKHSRRYRKADSGQQQAAAPKPPSPEDQHPEGEGVADACRHKCQCELHLAPSPQKTRPVEWVSVIVLGLTLGVLAIYTYHVAQQTSLLRVQTESLKTTQQLDQRAWVGIEAVALAGSPEVGKPLTHHHIPKYREDASERDGAVLRLGIPSD